MAKTISREAYDALWEIVERMRWRSERPNMYSGPIAMEWCAGTLAGMLQTLTVEPDDAE